MEPRWSLMNTSHDPDADVQTQMDQYWHDVQAPDIQAQDAQTQDATLQTWQAPRRPVIVKAYPPGQPTYTAQVATRVTEIQDTEKQSTEMHEPTCTEAVSSASQTPSSTQAAPATRGPVPVGRVHNKM